MKCSELVNRYNLHDSLLESVTVSNDGLTVVLIIDFCNWAQDQYKETEPETHLIRIVFYNVETFVYDDHKLNSDTILNAKSISSTSIEIVTLHDETNEISVMTISEGEARIEKIDED